MMKKTIILSGALLLGLSAFTSNAQQLPNVGFDSWKGTCGNTRSVPGDDRQRPGVEPTGWNGSNVNQHVFFDKKESGLVTQQTDGSNKYVQLKNIYIGVLGIGSVAPGFINLGTPWVYASSDVDNCDGGVFGGTEFTKKPDAITGRYKRTDANNENSHIITYLWNGKFTSEIGSIDLKTKEDKDDVDRVVFGKATGTANGKLVASCDSTFTSTKDGDWETITVPLNYVADAGEPTMMNVIVSAGDYWNRGNMTNGTTLLADDVDFVYYSTLTSLTVGGNAIALQDGVYTYNLAGRLPASADAIAATCKSQFAKAAITIDEANYQVKIVVTNQGGKDLDGLTEHTYVLQYKAQKSQNYDGILNVQMGGEDVIANADKSVTITYYNDGTCDFVLPNFSFAGTSLGDISVPGVKVTEDAAGTKTFTDGEVEAMKLADGEIVAHVVLNGGTITADGVINMPITVGWMMGYPNDKTETPINVLFSSDRQYEYKVDGYYHVLDADDAILAQNVPTTFKAWKSGDLNGVSYTLSLDGVKAGNLDFGDLKVTGLDFKNNKEFTGTDAAVTLPEGKTASVEVKKGDVAEVTRLKLEFVATVDSKPYTIWFTTNTTPTGVDGVVAAQTAVTAGEGVIRVSGFAGVVDVYTADGRKVASATANGEAQVAVAAGIYVVRAGDKAAKVIVK